MDSLPQLAPGDHDLLVELKTTVANLREDVRELAASVKDKNDDHEQRLRKIENTYVSYPKVIAMITALAALIGALWWIKP